MLAPTLSKLRNLGVVVVNPVFYLKDSTGSKFEALEFLRLKRFSICFKRIGASPGIA